MPKDQGGEPSPRSNTEEDLSIRTHADGSALRSADAIALRDKSPVSGCAHIPSTLRGLLKKQKATMNASKALPAGKVRAEARARTTHGGWDEDADAEVDPESSTNDVTSSEANDNHHLNYDNPTIKKLGSLATPTCRKDWKYDLISNLCGMKKAIAMEVQQQRAKRRNHDDDNRQDGNPNVATLSQLFAPTLMPTDTTMQVPPGLPTPGTVHPHVVQDTLATGLLQSLQPTEHGEESQRPALQVPSTLNSATPHDPQLLYAEFIEDEIERSGELISAARTDGRTTTIPTWE